MNFERVRQLMSIWAVETYISGLKRITIINDDELRYVTERVLNRINIAYVNMDGNSISGLGKNVYTELRCQLTPFSVIFNTLIEGKYFSPAYYVVKIVEDGLERGVEEAVIAGYVQRGLRAMASFFRELDLEYKIKRTLPECEIIRTIDNDIYRHTDLLVNYNNRIFRLWSYQVTFLGILNCISKLRGERGELPEGIHVLCPFNNNNVHEEYYGWWLYSQSTINTVIQKIIAGNADNYDEILNNYIWRYIKNVNIFIKG